MTVLQDLLAEVGDDARRVDPVRLAARARTDANRHRRAHLVGGLAGSAALACVVVALWPHGDTSAQRGSVGAASDHALHSSGQYGLLRLLLAAGFAVAAGVLVGWRDRTTRVPRLERALAGLWAASLAGWVVGAVELFHAVFIGLYFIGHPYVTLVGAGVVPLLAVLLLVNGSARVRGLTVLALAAQSAVPLSLHYASLGNQPVGGYGKTTLALSLAESLVALAAAAAAAWRNRAARGTSPSWQLVALWAIGAPVLANLFVYDFTPRTAFHSRWPEILGFGTGLFAHGLSWGAGTLALLVVGAALWRSQDSWAGLAVVVGLMTAMLAAFSLNLYSNNEPYIGRGWGPYLGLWWLSGLLVVAWLAVHRRIVQRTASLEG